MSVLELTDATFDEVVGAAGVPVLVEFTAPWCRPCTIMAPVLEQLASELDGELLVGTLDVDGNRVSMARHRVMGTPTMVLFVDGREQHRLVGARGTGRLRNELAPFLTP
ncbi:MAG: thioredoxin family protein [Actinomycetota bacterium]|nr:thioredoxin family protein [Actinomycetota bacterium]